jgi:sigma-B regulation protein RsbU (phosphoserine phosphatase)
MISVLFGYVFFVIFITKVGINHFLLKAEMSLAKEIHEVLVPEINYSKNGYEIYGKSIPTSEVGGDLVDVVESGNNVYCTIADVSGHGVSSGVYTGMFKSSLRTILNSRHNLNEMLTEVNDSLFPLTKKNMFITSSIIKLTNTNEAEFTVAGHLPVIHYAKSENIVKEHLIKQIPIGVKTAFQFKSDRFHFGKGDIIAIITDGITETTDQKKNEFGIERVKDLIKDNRNKSAEGISKLIFAELEKFGNQKDDNTLLIIKC